MKRFTKNDAFALLCIVLFMSPFYLFFAYTEFNRHAAAKLEAAELAAYRKAAPTIPKAFEEWSEVIIRKDQAIKYSGADSQLILIDPGGRNHWGYRVLARSNTTGKFFEMEFGVSPEEIRAHSGVRDVDSAQVSKWLSDLGKNEQLKALGLEPQPG